MTEIEELAGNLPLQYFDGSDYCTVKDATGGDFALTVQPDLMKAMEDALRSASRPDAGYVVKPLEWTECRSMWFQTSVCPRYEINPAVPSGYRLTYAGIRIDAPADGGAFEAVDAAKAAAQADFEQRIRSAITTVGTVEPGYVAGFEACREAAKQALATWPMRYYPCNSSGLLQHQIDYAREDAMEAIAALPAPAGESVTEVELSRSLRDRGALNPLSDARALLSAFTITRKEP